MDSNQDKLQKIVRPYGKKYWGEIGVVFGVSVLFIGGVLICVARGVIKGGVAATMIAGFIFVVCGGFKSKSRERKEKMKEIGNDLELKVEEKMKKIKLDPDKNWQEYYRIKREEEEKLEKRYNKIYENKQ